MLKNIEVTLYDIFGYLLPGSVALGALYLCWATFHPYAVLWRPHRIDTWLLLAFIAYYLGHIVQSLGNLFEYCIVGPREVILGPAGQHRRGQFLVGPYWAPIDPNLRAETVKKIQELVCTKIVDDPKGQWIYESCAELIAQRGRGEGREMYEYREGFYRGSAIALILLAIAPIRVLLCGADVRISPHTSASRGWIFVLTGLSLVGAFACFRRFGRFAGQRVRRTLLGFWVIAARGEERAPEARPSRGSPAASEARIAHT